MTTETTTTTTTTTTIDGVFSDSVKSLAPPHAILDLLSVGVCVRCVLRLFGYRGNAYCYASILASLLQSVLEEKSGVGGNDEVNEVGLNGLVGSINNGKVLVKDGEICVVCLGILQFILDQDMVSVSTGDMNCLVGRICEFLKREEYQLDGFSVEISVPTVVVANERAIWLYMKKYDAEEWFKNKFASDSISLKEALRLSITTPLENQLASRKLQTLLAWDHNSKKRKTEAKENGIRSHDIFEKKSRSSDDDAQNEPDAAMLRYLSAIQDPVFQELFTLPPEKVVEPSQLTITCYRKPIYIGGRYLKFSRKVSQSRWIIDDERMGEASVEEIVGNNALLVCKGDNYKFHAAGREDIDVRMLGSGRPFLVEISNARKIPTLAEIDQIACKVNDSDQKYVQVRNFSILGGEVWNMMREGEAEKQKQYAALVWISRPLSDEDMHSLSSAKDLEIMQRTPVRVLHRRSPLERKRIIHWMMIERINTSCQYFLLHLCTQAGTYIKEFVHGDLGRTHPSIGSMLGCRAEILQLDVTDVKMDLFN